MVIVGFVSVGQSVHGRVVDERSTSVTPGEFLEKQNEHLIKIYS